jgi:hypothetical protein
MRASRYLELRFSMKMTFVPLCLFAYIAIAHAQSEATPDATPSAEFVPTKECLSLQNEYERVGQKNPDSKHFYDHTYPALTNAEVMQRSKCETDRIVGESAARTESFMRKIAEDNKQEQLKKAKFDAEMAKIAETQKESERAFSKSYDARIAKEAAERKSRLAKLPPCCRIGMTTAEVLTSRKGSPDTKNRTVTANHVREQWVYKYGEYLYFDDGVLTAIQD